jgi:hypothetical protein
VLLNLFAIFLAVAPFVAKAVFWLAVNRVQTWSANWATTVNGTDAAASYSLCLNSECREAPLWAVTLGLEHGGLLWLAPLVLVAYNGARLFLTYRVSYLRDAEERTGYSPRFRARHPTPFAQVDPLPAGAGARIRHILRRTLHAYAWLHRVDGALKWLLVVSAMAFVWHVYTWMRLTVWLPA